MRYITHDDLQRGISTRSLSQLSNDDPSAREPDMVIVEQIVNGAEELIDGYLRARYSVPLTSTPTIVRDLTLTLTKYALYARRPESAVPETLTEQHNNALKLLDQIQKGAVTLGIISEHCPVIEKGALRVKAPKRKFGESVLATWRSE